MKKQLLLIATAVLFALNAIAQNTGYEAAIGKNLGAMGRAATVEDMQQVANNFERIANAEQQAWLPLYYATMSYISMSNKEKNEAKKDQYLDKGQQHLDKALKLAPKESELYVLQGWLHQTRLQVSPTTRGMKYSSLTIAALEKAKQLNPDNPRAYYLLGATLFYTPKMFGGGATAAKPLLEEAMAKFAAETTTSAIAPTWGKPQAEALLAQCE
ncbi:hypothetical protein [Pontibacter sp. SGAir0037]|uniref:hypothetical protein n=1 Tax=Pontibacter sp. SGAir0037 TaxID=2571030 RepID=UPI0010CD3351|nr:hypothetical protein [Pontibacter sp. SGAir0037]QCR24135.1 hypothetical protein C1N53_18410 [Pontibacter sp. SGAir0037]